MFSRRVPASFAPNALTRALGARRAAGLEVLDLTESNPTRADLEYDADAILDALRSRDSLVYAPNAKGLRRAREAVAAYYATSRGVSVDPERIVLTASTSEGYSFVLQLLCDPGDRVLVPAPSYPLFDSLAMLQSVGLDRYPLAYDGAWHLDLHALASHTNERTRAALSVHPNNPTGSFVKRDERRALDAFAAQRGLALVSDEVFADDAFADDPTREPTFATDGEALAFTMSGLSKVAGLPQAKLAWIVVSGPRGLVDDALTRLEWIADTYLSVSTPVQHAAASLLASRSVLRDAITRRVRSNLDALRQRLANDRSGACSLLHVEGGWYATLRVPATHSDEAWALTLLERDGVLVQPGFFFDFGHGTFLVLSLLTPPLRFAAAIDRVLARIGAETR